MVVITVPQKTKRRIIAFLSVVAMLLLARYAVELGGDRLVAGGKLQPVRSVNTTENRVALTFDISWGEKTLEPVLRVLAEEGVRCTFFVSGTWSATHPDLLRRIVADGHEIGSHGHRHLNYSRYPREVVLDNLRQAHTIIKEIAGVEPVLFRPPNGDFNDTVIEAGLEMGYTTVLWDTDSLDWKNPGVDFMVKRVSSRTHPGDIILMHASDSAKETSEALPLVIKAIRSKGFEILTVTALLRLASD